MMDVSTDTLWRESPVAARRDDELALSGNMNVVVSRSAFTALKRLDNVVGCELDLTGDMLAWDAGTDDDDDDAE